MTYYIHKAIEDNQTVELSAYRSFPENLEVKDNEWVSPFRVKKADSTPVVD